LIEIEKIDNEIDKLESAVAKRLKESRSLSEMSAYTRDRFDPYKLIDLHTTEGDLRLNESTELTADWAHELLLMGVNPTLDDQIYAALTFHAWLNGDYVDKPVIVAAPPAFGKSTMLSIFLRYMTDKHPDIFGAVVVKERIDDVQALTDEINNDGKIINGKHRAYAIRGYDQESMTREQYDAQFTDQVGFNVVVMTTKQLELQALKDNLRVFTEFIDDSGTSRPRRLLLIDEKPSLVVNHTLTVRGLNNFLTDVAEAGRLLRGRLQPYYKRVLPIVNEIREKLESAEDYPQGRFPAIDPHYNLPVQLKRDYSAIYGNEKMKLMRAFERIVRHGGEYHVYEGCASIVTTQVIHYRYTLFTTFILDGTGTKDPDYNASDFYSLVPEHMPTYSNVTFFVCETYSLSKASLKKSDDSLDEIASMIKRIVADKDSLTLVVTYKEYIASLESRLCDEIAAGKVQMKHFDGGRGSNAYIGADNAIYIGSLFKGTSFYTTAAQAIVGDRIDDEIDSAFDVTQAGINFHDNFVNEYRQLDIAVNLVQETNRLRASRKANKVNIYLFNKDRAMIDHILSAYPGSNIENFEPIEKLSGKKKATDLIIEYFAGMESEEKVKGSEVYRQIGIDRTTMNRAMKDERVQRALQDYHISRVGNSYVKAGDD
jgi:hypothetical protein